MSGKKISDKGDFPSTPDELLKSKPHSNEVKEVEGDAEQNKYDDSEEVVRKQQEEAVKKAPENPQKPGSRN